MNKSIPKGWLWAARILVLAISALAVIVYVVGTPVYFAQLVSTHHCFIQDCPSPTIVRSLHTMGIPIATYAAYMTALNVLFALVYFAVAAFIFWRKSDDWMALLACLALVTFGASFPSIPVALANVHPAWELPVTIVGNEDILGFPSLFVFLFLFPNGRFVPRWTLLAACVSVILFELINFFPNARPNPSNWAGLLLFLVPVLVIGSLVYAQIYRYRRISTPAERQQTKWIVLGAAVALLVFLLLGYFLPALLTTFMPSQNLGLLPYVIVITSIMLVLLLIPLSLAFALLRYRLWDVDVLINKTLVYGWLTALLAGVYIGLIIGLQALLRGIIKQNNYVAIVISTLAIAALVGPLRRRIQQIIDRRFYRSKYDATKVIAEFSATLRQEIELNKLSEQLVAVVQETMQPAHVSLWLRPPEQNENHK